MEKTNEIFFKFGFLVCLLLSAKAIQWDNPILPAGNFEFLTPEQVKQGIAKERAVNEAKKILKGCQPEISFLVADVSLQNRIPARIVAADIMVESSCNSRAVSKAGAIGLMQVNKQVWKTDKNLFNPQENVQFGTKILAGQARRYGIRNGLRRYFGVTAGSSASDEYATKVLMIAYRHTND